MKTTSSFLVSCQEETRYMFVSVTVTKDAHKSCRILESWAHLDVQPACIPRLLLPAEQYQCQCPMAQGPENLHSSFFYPPMWSCSKSVKGRGLQRHTGDQGFPWTMHRVLTSSCWYGLSSPLIPRFPCPCLCLLFWQIWYTVRLFTIECKNHHIHEFSWLILIINLMGYRITMEMQQWLCLEGCFQKSLAKRWPSLNVSSSIPKTARVAVSTSLSWLTAGAVSHVASRSCHYTFPTRMDCISLQCEPKWTCLF